MRTSCTARRRERFSTIRAHMVEESEPALYFYKLRMGTHEQTGLAACYSVDEYDTGLVKKHEKTRRDKEDDRTRHITELRAQTGPVFLTYHASAAVDAVAARVAKTAAALRLCRAGWRRTYRLEGDGRGSEGRRRRLRRAAGPLHRRRAPSCGECGEGADVAGAGRRQRRRCGGRLVPGGGVPRQPDAGAAVQPDGEGPGGPDTRGVHGRGEGGVRRSRGRAGDAREEGRLRDVPRRSLVHARYRREGRKRRHQPPRREHPAGPPARTRSEDRRRPDGQAHRLRRRDPRDGRTRDARHERAGPRWPSRCTRSASPI